jgi:hypothetical protein
MQNYNQIPETETLTSSRLMLLNNDLTIASCFSGTVFPTANLQVGMLCFRTDQQALYQLTSVAPVWRLILRLADTAPFQANTGLTGLTNLNSYTTSGAYALPSTGLSNNPTGAAEGVLAVFERGTSTFQTLCTPTGEFWYRAGIGSPTKIWTAWAKTWNQNNDGAASGLDADLLDGQQGSFYAPISSPNFGGDPKAPTRPLHDDSTSIATTAFVQAESEMNVAKSGDTMTGPLVLSGNADDPLEAVPLQQLESAQVNQINGGQLAGFRNKIINGKMIIAQQGNTFVAVAPGTFTIDRWQSAGTNSAAVTVERSTDVPPNNEFIRSLKNTFVTGDASIATSESYMTQQNVEGLEARDLIGNDFTISFWVKASVVGTYCVSLRNNGNDRSYIAEYSVTSVNTWEFKSITISGGLITAGTWDWGNSVGMRVSFVQAAGASHQTTPNAWQTGMFFGTSNQVNCLATNGNSFAITGVQIERGKKGTPFEHRPTHLEYFLCQRYFYRRNFSAGNVVAILQAYSTSAAFGALPPPAMPMRGVASSVTSSALSTFNLASANSTSAAVVTNFALAVQGDGAVYIGNATRTGGGLTAGNAAILSAATDAYIQVSAEI